MNEPAVCSMCGERRARSGESVGRWNFGPLTVAVTMPARVCDACGETTIAGDDLARAEHAVTRALVSAGSTHPHALRWLRKGAGLRAVDLAALLGVAPETVSRWENGARTIDRAALAVLAGLALDAIEGATTTRDRLRDLGSHPAEGEVAAVA